jgi:hypothetical protein
MPPLQVICRANREPTIPVRMPSYKIIKAMAVKRNLQNTINVNGEEIVSEKPFIQYSRQRIN